MQGLWLRDKKVKSHVVAKTEAYCLKEKQFGKLREEEDEEEEPATEQSRAYTDLGLNLGEREEQVSCHTLALA